MKTFFIVFVIFLILIVGTYIYVRLLSSPTVIAHRGASYWAPEETEPSYLLAKKMGADYLEMDIQKTSDGVLIAIHDSTFERTTNIQKVFPSRASDPIGSFSWAEVQQLDAGSWFNRDYPERARKSYIGLKILSLDEIIDLAGSDGRLYIESKSPELYSGYEKQIVDLLRRKGILNQDRIVFQSFDLNSLMQFKKYAPEITRIWLLPYKHSPPWNEVLAKAKGVVQGLGPDGYNSFPWHVIPAHRAGFLIETWTLDKVWQMWLAKAFRVDGIFTSRCETALVFYGKKKPIDIEAFLQSAGYEK